MDEKIGGKIGVKSVNKSLEKLLEFLLRMDFCEFWKELTLMKWPKLTNGRHLFEEC